MFLLFFWFFPLLQASGPEASSAWKQFEGETQKGQYIRIEKCEGDIFIGDIFRIEGSSLTIVNNSRVLVSMEEREIFTIRTKRASKRNARWIGAAIGGAATFAFVYAAGRAYCETGNCGHGLAFTMGLAGASAGYFIGDYFGRSGDNTWKFIYQSVSADCRPSERNLFDN